MTLDDWPLTRWNRLRVTFAVVFMLTFVAHYTPPGME